MDNNILLIIGAALLISATSFSGALLTANFFKRGFKKYQAILVSFAAGVFVVAGGGVLVESFSIGETNKTIIFFLGSIIVFHMLSLLWPEHHYHQEDNSHCEDCKPRAGTARRILIGDSIHNIVDGMLLVPAFLVSVEFGLLTVFAIWLHEVVQEVSEFIIFKNAGYSTKKALRLNALSALTIFVGVGASLLALELVHDLEGVLLAIAAGAFLYIALNDLVPHSVRHGRKNKKYGLHVTAFLLGVSTMFILGQIGVEHSHGIDGYHTHSEEHSHQDIDNHEEAEYAHEEDIEHHDEHIHKGEDHHHDHESGEANTEPAIEW